MTQNNPSQNAAARIAAAARRRKKLDEIGAAIHELDLLTAALESPNLDAAQRVRIAAEIVENQKIVAGLDAELEPNERVLRVLYDTRILDERDGSPCWCCLPATYPLDGADDKNHDRNCRAARAETRPLWQK